MSSNKDDFSAGIPVVESSAETNAVEGPTLHPLSQKWTNLINAIRAPIKHIILKISDHAANNPWFYVFSVVTISLVLIATGIFTNFSVDVNEDTLWTPRNTRPLSHGEWINEESGFPSQPRNFLALVHRNGNNVLGIEGTQRAFDTIDAVREIDNYDSLCQLSDHVDFNGDETCPLYAVTNFWNDTESFFNDAITTDEEAVRAISAQFYPNGAPVDIEQILGNPVRGEDGILISAESLVFVILLPDTEDAEDLETKALDNIFNLQDAWSADDNTDFVLQVFADRSFSDEFTRAIVSDIPLVPVVFIIMSIFTCVVFWRKDWVYSRTLLGLGAVVTVFLAIMSGYGILFIIGVPFTSMTQILPFIMFGIGLDNAFIISGEYWRTDRTKTSAERLHITMDEVGLSIFLTTTTSVVAFALGTMSSVPAVFWLCQYAAPTIFINFIYQLTFFVALIVIDDKRVANSRRDCLVCLTVKSRVGHDNSVEEQSSETWFDRFISWYADALFNPFVAAFILLAFAALFGGCAYSASLLTQDFQFTDVVPKDSYVADFWDDYNEYSSQTGVRPGVYFRDVDQCNTVIQQQMDKYVNDLVDMDEVTEQPVFFWLRDFQKFVDATENVQDLSCGEQVTAFLANPVYYDLYHKDMVLNSDGEVIESRTSVRFDKVDQEAVTEQVDALENQRAISTAQPVNKGRDDWAFFTFDQGYYIWQFYAVAPDELTQTTIAGVVAVSVLAMILIPHWTAILFVAPMISILYVDLLGVLQFAGIHVNAVSYISLVMSIGLLVDFLMHVLLRYYESNEIGRKAKVKDTLKTMGASILVGAVSTFLGVIPLAFSSSEIFSTIFVTFIGLVTLGAGHGLILLPVLLSVCGPNVNVKGLKDEGLAADEASVKEPKAKTLDPKLSDIDLSRASEHSA